MRTVEQIRAIRKKQYSTNPAYRERQLIRTRRQYENPEVRAKANEVLKAKRKTERLELVDRYVKERLIISGIDAKLITPEMIEQKRTSLRLKRSKKNNNLKSKVRLNTPYINKL